MPLPRGGHRPREGVGASQFQPEDAPAVDPERRAAVEQQCGGDIAARRQQVAEDPRFHRRSGGQVDEMVDVSVDVEVRAVLEPVRHRAVGVLLEPLPHIDGHRARSAGSARVRPFQHGDMVGQEALRRGVPLRIGDALAVLGSDVQVVVVRLARRRQVGVADPAVTADRHRMRARQPLPVARPRQPAERASQLVGGALCRRVRPRQCAQQRIDDQRLAGTGQCHSVFEHRRRIGSRVGGREARQQAADFGEQPRPVRRDPAERDAGLHQVQGAQFARREFVEAVAQNPLLGRRTLQRHTAGQGSARPVRPRRRVRDVHGVECGAQAEATSAATDQPRRGAPPFAERDGRYGATSFECHGMRVGLFGHRGDALLRTFRCWRTSSTRTR